MCVDPYKKNTCNLAPGVGSLPGWVRSGTRHARTGPYEPIRWLPLLKGEGVEGYHQGVWQRGGCWGGIAQGQTLASQLQ